MNESLLQFIPSGSELTSAGIGMAESTLGDLEIASTVTGTNAIEPDAFEDRIPQLAREATHRAFREAEAGPVGATVIRDGWICRVQNDEVVERIKRAPMPVRARGGVLSYQL